MEEIEAYHKVREIKRHFEEELLLKLKLKIEKINLNGEARIASTYQAEDTGFLRAKNWVLEIIEKEIKNIK